MSKAEYSVAELSNAFSTGNGGGNFERNVQAAFLLAVLVDGFSPVLESPVNTLEFQAHHLGYAVDDLVVISSDNSKLLCQIKHSLAITENDTTFQEVVTAAWHDFNSQFFDRSSDKIALISGSIAKESIRALRYIHEQSLSSPTADAFFDRIYQGRFTAQTIRDKFETIKKCLQKANENQPIPSDHLWEFCQCFTLLIFDFDYRHSINRILAHALIRCKTDVDAKLVWSRLADFCGNQNPNAASITRDNLPPDILSMFGLAAPHKEVPIISANFTPSRVWAIISLIGCWDENNKHDIEAVEEISGKNYAEFQNVCRELLLSNSRNITLQNGIWQAQNRRATIDAVRSFYFDNTIKYAFRVSDRYLKETSRQITDDREFSIMIPASGRFNNSDGFRKGLIEGLCILSNGATPRNCTENLLITESQKLIYSVFKNMNWERLVSMSDTLQCLAEINPSVYLSCLEKMIHSKPQEVEKLFPKKKNRFLIDQNFITNLLFTLEALAWDGEYIVQCIRCLGELERLNYEQTNWVNTPINTIVSILSPFLPRTCASIEKQENAVQALKVDDEELCWDVLTKLLPQGGSTVISDTTHPKYLNISIPDRIEISEENQKSLFQHYIHEAISLADNDSSRLAQLFEHTAFMTIDDIACLLNKICDASSEWSDEEQCAIWLKLCELKYRAILDNDGTSPTTEIFMQLCNTINIVHPKDILYQHRRLYLSHFNEFLLNKNGWEELDKNKQSAIEEIYREKGLNAVIAFGKNVNALYEVGARLGQILNTSEFMNTFTEYRTENDVVFYSNLIRAFFRKNGIAVVHEIVGLETEEPAFIAKLLNNAPFTQELVDMIPEYLHENESLFWKTIDVPPYHAGFCEYRIADVVNKLLLYHRADAAVRAVGQSVDVLGIEDALLNQILIQAPMDGNAGSIDRYSVCKIIKYLQNSDITDVNALSEIEYIYLPWLDEYSSINPKAINYRLANEPACFCDLMEIAYKKRNETSSGKTLSQGARERIFQLTYHYKIIPGTDWIGVFHAEIFKSWLSAVKTWAEENDRYEVAMHTIGEGLSYANYNDNNVLDTALMVELNKPENDDLRMGYRLGILNQRGVHWIDPEGKSEKKLARLFEQRANTAEAAGYSRFSELLRNIANGYVSEAKENAKKYALNRE